MKRIGLLCTTLAVLSMLAFSIPATAAVNPNEVGPRITQIRAELTNLQIQIKHVEARGLDAKMQRARVSELELELRTMLPVRETRPSLDQGNDNCPATIVGALPYTDSGTTTGNANDFTCDGNTAADVVYQMTAPTTGNYTFQTCNGSNYDTRLEVRTGACPGADWLCNDDACGLLSVIVTPLNAGDIVTIVVDGFSANEGNYTLDISVELVVPDNDDCADATPISEGTFNYNTDNATTDGPAECLSFGDDQVNQDIWYLYTASCTEDKTFSLCGSDYDTRIAVYAGSSCPTGPGTAIACNDDFCGLQSEVTVSVVEGQQYLVRVGGFTSATGSGTLTIQSCPVRYCGPTDLVFAVDVTGSMGGAIASVVAELPTIIALANATSGGDLRLGLVTFHDEVHTLHNLTANIALVQASIAGLSASGGNNEPEASDEALREIITQNSACTDGSEFTTGFRPFANKIIVLITDARPAGCDDDFTPGVDDVVANQRALDAQAAGIRIAAVYVPTFNFFTPEIVPIMQDYALTTSGSYSLTNSNGTGTGAAINAIVEDCGQGEIQVGAQVPPLECIEGDIVPNPVVITVTVSNTGDAPCTGGSLTLSNGAGPGGTGTVTSANPVAIPNLPDGGSVNINFTLLLVPNIDGGCITYTAVYESDDCPRAFFDICVNVPECGNCEFPFDGVDQGDLFRCNYPTLRNNPGHGLSGIAWLGECVTGEGLPDIFDNDLCDDGVRFIALPWTPCEWEQVSVLVTAGPNYARYARCGGQLYLSAWKDGNLDGDFCDELCLDNAGAAASEWIIQDLPVIPGVHTIDVLDPGVFDLSIYDGAFRFRLTSHPVGRFGFGLMNGSVCPLCTCGDFDFDFLGEVEDYYIPDAQLSVELATFDAAVSSDHIALRWTTASETNNDHFEVTRNGDLVASIASQGDGATSRSYTWADTRVAIGGIYTYALIAVDLDGNREELATRTVTMSAEFSGTVTEYALHQNFPNPFNPATSIAFDLLEAGHVKLTVYNVTGQQVGVLANSSMSAGRHVVSFDASSLPSGLYLYKLESGSFSAQRKMLLMK